MFIMHIHTYVASSAYKGEVVTYKRRVGLCCSRSKSDTTTSVSVTGSAVLDKLPLDDSLEYNTVYSFSFKKCDPTRNVGSRPAI